MKTFDSINGRSIVINAAPFKEVMNLKDAVFQAVKRSGINISDINIDFSNQNSASVLNQLLIAVLEIDSDEKFQKCLFACLIRCTFNSEKITAETFDNVENRGDYYNIVIECLKENLTPFFLPLLSKLKDQAVLQNASASQK